jgi:hypothetical protein
MRLLICEPLMLLLRRWLLRMYGSRQRFNSSIGGVTDCRATDPRSSMLGTTCGNSSIPDALHRPAARQIACRWRREWFLGSST